MIVNPTLEHGDEGKHHFHLLVTLIHFCCFDKHLILLFINKWKRKTATSKIYVYVGFRPGSITHLLHPIASQGLHLLNPQRKVLAPFLCCGHHHMLGWCSTRSLMDRVSPGILEDVSGVRRTSFKSRLGHFLDMWLWENILSEPQLAHVWNRNLNSAFIRWLWDSTEKNYLKQPDLILIVYSTTGWEPAERVEGISRFA